MGNSTKIEWTDSSFQPWMGCTKVGPGCDNCYAGAMMDKRLHRVQWGAGQPRMRTSAANWRKPIAWNAHPFVECMGCHWRGEAIEANLVLDPPGFHPPVPSARLCPVCDSPTLKHARRRVFCASLADVFDNEVDSEWRRDLLRLISSTPNLDWLLLTKRIGNAAAMLTEAAGSFGMTWGEHWRNVWIGATVVNQAEADRDIPKLLAVPARVRFLSVEPMLGPINLHPWFCEHGDVAKPEQKFGHFCDASGAISWVIAGGESGPHARPMHPDWARSLRDQCAAAGIPYLFKQWGEWAPGECAQNTLDMRTVQTADWFADEWRLNAIAGNSEFHRDDEPDLYRAGKRAAGRLLDGREWNGFPEVSR